MAVLGPPPQSRGCPGLMLSAPLSPQLLHIISFLTLRDLLSLDPTCRCLPSAPLSPASAWPCKRAAILNWESAVATGAWGWWHFVPQPVTTSQHPPLQTPRGRTCRAWAAAGSEH